MTAEELAVVEVGPVALGSSVGSGPVRGGLS